MSNTAVFVHAPAPSARATAIPGGGTGKNSAFMFRQPDGSYQAGEEAQQTGSGTSIFDPVLCELAYRWFCPPGGTVLDPFAGGSVRGVVASKLGRPYVGIDLRAEQVGANNDQSAAICGVPMPQWIEGDSRDVLPRLQLAADFVFTCPPYADLERYSDDPRDISTMAYPQFLAAYTEIIVKACALLRRDRFACLVVGDARGKDGNYYGLPGDTVGAFKAAGLALYNEAVLITAVGSLPVRVTRQFNAGRKLGKTHQNVLVFVKGARERPRRRVSMETKLSKVLEAMDADDWRRAFSIASKFGRLGAQEEAIMRAQSALLKPGFYRQLGRCPSEIIEAGKVAMRARFEPMRGAA